ncbi:hypothetical protein FRC03_007307 [Tulasnella sp. 419]|nr:hypothetical protein FRC03_007307 [Tulasnella sp. 419]
MSDGADADSSTTTSRYRSVRSREPSRERGIEKEKDKKPNRDDAMQIDEPRRARGPPLPTQDERFRSHRAGPPTHLQRTSSSSNVPTATSHRPAPINTNITTAGATSTPVTAPPSGPPSASTRPSGPPSAVQLTPNPIVAAAYGRRAGPIPSGPRHHQLQQQQTSAKEPSNQPNTPVGGSGKQPPKGPRTAVMGDTQPPRRRERWVTQHLHLEEVDSYWIFSSKLHLITYLYHF